MERPWVLYTIEKPSNHQSVKDYRFYDVHDAHGTRVFCLSAEGDDIPYCNRIFDTLLQAVNTAQPKRVLQIPVRSLPGGVA